MGAKKRFWPAGLALLSGVMLALCFPPFDLGVMVWLGMIPLLVAVWGGGAGAKRRWTFGFRTGYLAGVAFWFLNLKWIAEVGVIGLIAVALFLSLYFALWGAFAAGPGNPWLKKEESGADEESGIEAKIRAKNKTGVRKKRKSLKESGLVLRFALVNALWWCGLEWVRGWFFTGFSWNGLGVAFHDSPVLAQGADLVGVTGLAFLPVFVMAVVVQVGRGLHREVKSGKLRPHWDFGVAMLVLAGAFIYGIWKLHGEKPGEVVPLRVLLVQLNIPQDVASVGWTKEEVHAGYEDDTLQALADLEERNAERARVALKEGSDQAVVLDVPDWIVWPESAMREPVFYVPDGRQALGPATRKTLDVIKEAGDYTLIMGMNEIEAVDEGDFFSPKDGGDHYNSMVAMLPEEFLFRSYKKQHLVLFGETIPYREYLPFLQWLWQLSAGTDYLGSFSAGTGAEPLNIPFGRSPTGEIAIIPSICFEDSVARLLRKYVKNGGQVIVNVTNDGWFHESEAAAQHFANAKFRSIELRRPTIRCANTGVSAVIGAHGTVLDKEKNEQRIVLDEKGSHLTRGWTYATAYVPVDGPVTLYAQLGDLFSALGLFAGIGWWIGRGRGARRPESGTRTERNGELTSEQG